MTDNISSKLIVGNLELLGQRPTGDYQLRISLPIFDCVSLHPLLSAAQIHKHSSIILEIISLIFFFSFSYFFQSYFVPSSVFQLSILWFLAMDCLLRHGSQVKPNISRSLLQVLQHHYPRISCRQGRLYLNFLQWVGIQVSLIVAFRVPSRAKGIKK